MLKFWDKIRPWFENFDAKAAIKVCELDYDQVLELCRLMTTKKWCMHPDLGIYMGRKSVMNSYMMNILGAACGVFGETNDASWTRVWHVQRTSGWCHCGASQKR